MFVMSFVSGAWQATCYLVGASQLAGGRNECVVVDPGMDAAAMVRTLADEHDCVPVAVLATHGHADHIADAAEVADGYNIPLWVRAADRPMLTDPAAGLSSDAAELVARLYPDGLREPARVELLDGHDTLHLAGLDFQVTPAPGHTPGCALFTTADDDGQPLVFTGDVLFAGSIGRTDMPGGDPATMRATLAGPVLALPDEAVILPGHGPHTSMRRERAANPYLQPDFLRN